MSQPVHSHDWYYCFVGLKNLIHVFTTGLPKDQKITADENSARAPRQVWCYINEAELNGRQSQERGGRWEGQPIAVIRFLATKPACQQVPDSWDQLRGVIPPKLHSPLVPSPAGPGNQYQLIQDIPAKDIHMSVRVFHAPDQKE